MISMLVAGREGDPSLEVWLVMADCARLARSLMCLSLSFYFTASKALCYGVGV